MFKLSNAGILPCVAGLCSRNDNYAFWSYLVSFFVGLICRFFVIIFLIIVIIAVETIIIFFTYFYTNISTVIAFKFLFFSQWSGTNVAIICVSLQ